MLSFCNVVPTDSMSRAFRDSYIYLVCNHYALRSSETPTHVKLTEGDYSVHRYVFVHAGTSIVFFLYFIKNGCSIFEQLIELFINLSKLNDLFFLNRNFFPGHNQNFFYIMLWP